jgi:hypothetical protein
MRTLKRILLVSLAAASMACGKENNENVPQLQSVNYLPCDHSGEEDAKSSQKAINSGEYIKYTTIDSQTLRFEQKIALNCCSEKIKVLLSVADNAIELNLEEYEGILCACMCASVVTYEVNNLKTGNTYTFIFKRYAQTYHTCSITFTDNLNEILY